MHVCLPVKRNFPAVKLRPQNPPIDKREIGDAAIPGKAEYILLPQPLPLTRAISQWARSLEWRHDVMLHILVGKFFHHFLPVLLRGMLPLFIINDSVALCFFGWRCGLLWTTYVRRVTVKRHQDFLLCLIFSLLMLQMKNIL